MVKNQNLQEGVEEVGIACIHPTNGEAPCAHQMYASGVRVAVPGVWDASFFSPLSISRQP